MATGSKPTDLTENKLIRGWASAPRVRIRQATPADLDAIADLVPLAGVGLEDQLVTGVTNGTAGAALRAGLRAGNDGFTRHIAEQFIAHADNIWPAFVHAALILVADHRDHGILGALIAYPPPNLVDIHLNQTTHHITDPHERDKLLLGGAIGVAKIKAIAVTPHARHTGLGGSLLKRCRQIYFHCGYVIIYGQMPPTPGLEGFYRRHGFTVLNPGEPIDLWVVFGIHSAITPDPTERIFIRHAPR